MKNILITGANTGIGLETVLQLVDPQTKIYFTCRSEDKAQETLKIIKDKKPEANVDYLLLDLSDLQSVKECATRFIQMNIPLHVLILNAGAATMGETTKQGYEMMFGVNHLGHFLLSLSLLPLLKSSSPSRIVVVSSNAHSHVPATLDIESLPTASYSAITSFTGYSISKLCNIWFTNELSRKLEGTKVTVNSLHPGAVQTDLSRNLPFFLKPIVEQGAKTSVFLAKDESVNEVSGKYFDKCHETDTTPQAQDPEAEKKLWELSERLVAEYL